MSPLGTEVREQSEIKTKSESDRELVQKLSASNSAKELQELDFKERQARIDDFTGDTRLKKIYAYWFIGILIGQLYLMNYVFMCVGFGHMKFEEPNHLNLYMGGTLAEVFGVVLVITRYLFYRKKSQ